MCLALLCCAAFALSSCKTSPAPSQGSVISDRIGALLGLPARASHAPGAQPLAHRWVSLSDIAAYPVVRQATYFTYVLAGEIGGPVYAGSNDQILIARRNLQALLREVKATQPAPPSTAVMQLRVLNLTSFNVFVVPVSGKPATGADELQSFDYGASRTLRETTALLLPGEHSIRRALQREGPFLLASRRPLHELTGITRTHTLPDQDPDLLFLDLTGTSDAAVPVYLNVFRDSIQQEGVDGRREIQSLRARLVSALLKLDALVPFIATASANLARPVAPERPAK
jgi:hypothetical protein